MGDEDDALILVGDPGLWSTGRHNRFRLCGVLQLPRAVSAFLAQRRGTTRTETTMKLLKMVAVALLAGVAGAALASQPAWATQYGPYEVHGAIEGKWLAAGGPASTLGLPVTNETGTPDGVGRFNHFANQASIYWTPDTQAQIVQGAIRGAWSRSGWERGPMGYPVTDENGAPLKTGRYSLFQRGIIYWSPASDAHEIQGRILDTWAAQGWENGRLGFPVSDEYAVAGGRAEDFQNGRIVWSPTSPTRVTVQDPTPEKFPNCAALRADYSHGVGLPKAVDAPTGSTFFLHDLTLGQTLYRANAALDTDRDGVACED